MVSGAREALIVVNAVRGTGFEELVEDAADPLSPLLPDDEPDVEPPEATEEVTVPADWRTVLFVEEIVLVDELLETLLEED
jgi:hypothetical protein